MGFKHISVRYDAIGPAKHNTWFCVKVFEGYSAVDERQTHLIALRNGVSFGNGVRYEGGAKKRLRPQGFVAYELWREAFHSKDIPVKAAHHHVDLLSRKRLSASEYMRELKKMFPEASDQFNVAADHYDRELELLHTLHDICHKAVERKSFTVVERTEARRLIGVALESERKAVKSIEGALRLLEGQ